MTAERERLRIGIVHSSLGVVRGGLETIASRFAAGLTDRGHEVTVVTGVGPGRPLLEDVARLSARVVAVPCLSATSWISRQLAALAPPGVPLLLQSRSFCSACRLHPGVRALVASADVTVTLQDYETVSFARWRRRHKRANLSYFAGAIRPDRLGDDASVARVAISETVAEAYGRDNGLRIDGVVTPGADGNGRRPERAVRAVPRNLLFVGRLEENKGVRELVQIFAYVARAVPEATLRVVGDGPLRSWLETACGCWGLADRVVPTGALRPEEVGLELESADLFLFPSHYESFGIAVLEAMAAGVPVVCSALPALEEVVGPAGLLLPADDIGAWVVAVERLLRDPSARQRMASAGWERAQRFTWSISMDQLERHLYRAASAAVD